MKAEATKKHRRRSLLQPARIKITSGRGVYRNPSRCTNLRPPSAATSGPLPIRRLCVGTCIDRRRDPAGIPPNHMEDEVVASALSLCSPSESGFREVGLKDYHDFNEFPFFFLLCTSYVHVAALLSCGSYVPT
jgi:hypothetical protein